MSRREQAGVIPFRRKKGAIEICLIRNKGRKKWKIPKGFVDPDETIEEAALKEAWEEAGLKGRLVGEPIGSYEYEKWEFEAHRYGVSDGGRERRRQVAGIAVPGAHMVGDRDGVRDAEETSRRAAARYRRGAAREKETTAMSIFGRGRLFSR